MSQFLRWLAAAVFVAFLAPITTDVWTAVKTLLADEPTRAKVLGFFGLFAVQSFIFAIIYVAVMVTIYRRRTGRFYHPGFWYGIPLITFMSAPVSEALSLMFNILTGRLAEYTAYMQTIRLTLIFNASLTVGFVVYTIISKIDAVKRD